LSDNLGVQRLLDRALAGGGLRESFSEVGIPPGSIRKLVLITVNAERDPSFNIDTSDKVPDMLQVVDALLFGTGARATRETQEYLRDITEQWRKTLAESPHSGGDVFAPNAEIIHIDIDPSNIGKNKRPDISVVADASTALNAILEKLGQTEDETIAKSHASRKEWWDKINGWRESVPLVCERSETEIKPQALIEELHRVTNGEAIIVTDVGQHQMWAAQFYPFKYSRQWLTSGGLGTMGFGLPAAMGALLGRPGKQVVAVVGDGGFQMTNQEIITAVQYNIPLKVVIMNNGYLGMVRQWQEMFYDRAYSEVDLSVSPDFVKLAEAYGALGLRAEKPDELAAVLEKGLAYKGVTIMDIVVSKEENVFPIVPAGGNARDMILK